MEPSTPEGVEHTGARDFTYEQNVMEPSTPEGVEHCGPGRVLLCVAPVMEPSTPEGVEHFAVIDDLPETWGE